MKKPKIIIVLIIVTQLLVGCKTMNNTQKGAAIGVAGGAAGALIGNYMDKQVEELQADLEGTKVERVGEGIKITFDSGILFNVNSSELGETAKSNITKLAVVVNKYNDTDILIEGHTDITGSADYNQSLSEKRASSVSYYLTINAVELSRLSTIGYGPNQPLVENNTAENRALNRRVEIAIFANDKLKKAAEKGQIGELE